MRIESVGIVVELLAEILVVPFAVDGRIIVDELAVLLGLGRVVRDQTDEAGIQAIAWFLVRLPARRAAVDLARAGATTQTPVGAFSVMHVPRSEEHTSEL